MTTKISTIYDAINTAVVTALGSDYLKIVNPYSLEMNMDLVLKKGYGIAFDSGFNTHREVKGNLWINQGITIVITNQIYTADDDPTGRALEEKTLMEDFIKVAKAIESNPTLSDSVATLGIGTEGIGMLLTDADNEGPKFLFLPISITTEFRETLT